MNTNQDIYNMQIENFHFVVGTMELISRRYLLMRTYLVNMMNFYSVKVHASSHEIDIRIEVIM